tara:strand:+ start:405 stop:860 length:456 start_codon:yes stop_codon:yes gene_type:complete
MKAVQINGSIKTYSRTPKTWGNVIGGFDLLSDSDLQSYGFYDVVIPEYNSSIQTLGDIQFDSENNVYTYPVQNLTWSETLSELKEAKIAILKSVYKLKLEETDWYIIRAQEGVAAPQEILDARATLRTECDTHETAINALTKKANVQSYEF